MEIEINELQSFLDEIVDEKSRKKERKNYLKYLKNRRKEVEFSFKPVFGKINKKFIEDALISNDGDKMVAAAMCLEYGAFVKQNLVRAHYLFKAAEMRDHPDGTYFLAVMYSKGVGDGFSNKLFLQYLKKAKDLGVKEAISQWDDLILAYKKYHNY